MSAPQGYDDLAAWYDDIYDDWPAVVRAQGKLLSELFQKRLGGRRRLRILDAACGIGTQAIGLTLEGHDVVGVDMSKAAAARAAVLGARMEAEFPTMQGDMRHIDALVEGPFDVVMACDNALPHLLTDDDIIAACRAARAKLIEGGVYVVSVRDYAKLAESRPTSSPIRRFGSAGSRRIVFQIWDWQDERTWIPELFIMRESTTGWEGRSFVLPAYRGITTEELAGLMMAAGFQTVDTLSGEETGYYQPILVARG